MNRLKIGSRGSRLALFQANLVRERLALSGVESDIVVIKTRGDIERDKPLHKIGDRGLFVREIERKLYEGAIDLAVHSLKDLPAELDEKFMFGAFLERERVEDVFISQKYDSIRELPEGATIATGSLRRASQLLSIRNDLKIVGLRGNIETRLKKIEEKNIDGIIMAAAGIIRLGLEEKISEYLKVEEFVPTAGQGIISVEIRREDLELKKILKKINSITSENCFKVEREFLKVSGSGCFLPIGSIVIFDGKNYKLYAYIGDLEGKNYLRDFIEFNDYRVEYGEVLANRMLESGGREILEKI